MKALIVFASVRLSLYVSIYDSFDFFFSLSLNIIDFIKFECNFDNKQKIDRICY